MQIDAVWFLLDAQSLFFDFKTTHLLHWSFCFAVYWRKDLNTYSRFAPHLVVFVGADSIAWGKNPEERKKEKDFIKEQLASAFKEFLILYIDLYCKLVFSVILSLME